MALARRGDRRGGLRGAAEGGPGLVEAMVVWALWLAVAIAVGVTYARVPSEELWGVTQEGLAGGAGRAIVLVAGPFAPVAVALAIVAHERWRAGAEGSAAAPGRAVTAVAGIAAILCLTVAVPGATARDDLDLRLASLPAAAGVGLALALTLYVAATTGIGAIGGWTTGDRARLALLGLLVVLALPWLVALLGFYASELPLLGRVVLAAEPTPGEADLPAVHLGYHEGLGGVLHAASALLLSRGLGAYRPRVAAALSLYLSLLLVYGLAVAASDAWQEQVVKRGWTSQELPDVLVPSFGPAWATLLLAAVVVRLLFLRPPAEVVRRGPDYGEGRA